jgi:hypothetical protein
LLDRAGIHGNVAALVAPTIDPAEVWALRVYARAARLTPGWIATQVFQFDRGRPRAAELSGRYDAAGRLLADLDPQLGEAILALVDDCCPEHPGQLHDPPLMQSGDAVRAAIEAVWSIMAEQRGGPHKLDWRPSTLPAVAGDACESGAALWQMVLARCRERVPAEECMTWLEASSLLELAGDVAVVAAPNVFVRDAIAARFEPVIAEALSAATGRKLCLELVIGTPTRVF